MSTEFRTAFLALSPEARVKFRDMRKRDIPAVLDIENRCYHYPWNENVYKDCMRVGYSCRVLETKGRIRAYGIVSVGAGAGEAHILNLCVDPDIHGYGYGETMLQHLLDIAKRKKAQTCFLEVRPSNKTAIRLYKRLGFRKIGARRSYYPGVLGREDAVTMSLVLGACRI